MPDSIDFSEVAGTRVVIYDEPTASLPPPPANWQSAELPALYIRAKHALAALDKTDECAEWINLASAYASYYRQARDRSLLNMATRIRTRAIRRCGQLYIEVKDETGETRKQHSERTGLKITTIMEGEKLAEIPDDVFDRVIEQDPPSSIKELLGVRVTEKRKHWSRARKRAQHLIDASHALFPLWECYSTTKTEDAVRELVNGLRQWGIDVDKPTVNGLIYSMNMSITFYKHIVKEMSEK